MIEGARLEGLFGHCHECGSDFTVAADDLDGIDPESQVGWHECPACGEYRMWAHVEHRLAYTILPTKRQLEKERRLGLRP